MRLWRIKQVGYTWLVSFDGNVNCVAPHPVALRALAIRLLFTDFSSFLLPFQPGCWTDIEDSKCMHGFQTKRAAYHFYWLVSDSGLHITSRPFRSRFFLSKHTGTLFLRFQKRNMSKRITPSGTVTRRQLALFAHDVWRMRRVLPGITFDSSASVPGLQLYHRYIQYILYCIYCSFVVDFLLQGQQNWSRKKNNCAATENENIKKEYISKLLLCTNLLKKGNSSIHHRHRSCHNG